jgi:hypothetical protein
VTRQQPALVRHCRLTTSASRLTRTARSQAPCQRASIGFTQSTLRLVDEVGDAVEMPRRINLSASFEKKISTMFSPEFDASLPRSRASAV